MFRIAAAIAVVALCGCRHSGGMPAVGQSGGGGQGGASGSGGTSAQGGAGGQGGGGQGGSAGAAGGSGGSSASGTGGNGGAGTGSPAFPLVPSANSRYLTDQAGVPFPILGSASWDPRVRTWWIRARGVGSSGQRIAARTAVH